tara:strand:+ start:1196 stop:1690 length:495 start_codon:yes stop_codon:yes gene_type:complete
MILQYFKRKENKEKKIAQNLYKKILYLSNSIHKKNSLFKEFNYNSSFEIVSIILIIFIKLNIKFRIENYKIINEYLISTFISDLDDSLRTKGIGDMSIGKYVKSYVKKFYYRLSRFPNNIEKIDYDAFLNYFNNFDIINNERKEEASSEFLKVYNNIKLSYKSE